MTIRDVLTRTCLIAACLVILQGCGPPMVARPCEKPQPTLESYRLDRTEYDYATDGVDADALYVVVPTGRSAKTGEPQDVDRVRRAVYRFGANGIFMQVTARTPAPEASVLAQDCPTYGVYGVREGHIKIQYYSEIDRVFYNLTGKVKPDTIYITWSNRASYSVETTLAKVPASGLHLYPLVYPGQNRQP